MCTNTAAPTTADGRGRGRGHSFIRTRGTSCFRNSYMFNALAFFIILRPRPDPHPIAPPPPCPGQKTKRGRVGVQIKKSTTDYLRPFTRKSRTFYIIYNMCVYNRYTSKRIPRIPSCVPTGNDDVYAALTQLAPSFSIYVFLFISHL